MYKKIQGKKLPAAWEEAAFVPIFTESLLLEALVGRTSGEPAAFLTQSKQFCDKTSPPSSSRTITPHESKAWWGLPHPGKKSDTLTLQNKCVYSQNQKTKCNFNVMIQWLYIKNVTK